MHEKILKLANGPPTRAGGPSKIQLWSDKILMHINHKQGGQIVGDEEEDDLMEEDEGF